MPNVVKHDQSQIVLDLLERQESALEELDSLNERVESAIKEITAQRELEIAELAAESETFLSISETSEDANSTVASQSTLTVKEAA